jgi:hypothetical protein
MALVKSILKQKIKAALDKQKAAESDPAASADSLAQDLTDAIDAYIKSATVTVAPGIPVATAGSSSAQTGATNGPGQGTIS